MFFASGEKLESASGPWSGSVLKMPFTAITGLGVQLSVALAASPTFCISWLGGQSIDAATELVTTGGVVSTTVNVVAQLAGLPAASFAVTAMLVTPSVSGVPATGVWDTVKGPGQLSVTVTPGSTLGTGA